MLGWGLTKMERTAEPWHRRAARRVNEIAWVNQLGPIIGPLKAHFLGLIRSRLGWRLGKLETMSLRCIKTGSLWQAWPKEQRPAARPKGKRATGLFVLSPNLRGEGDLVTLGAFAAGVYAYYPDLVAHARRQRRDADYGDRRVIRNAGISLGAAGGLAFRAEEARVCGHRGPALKRWAIVGGKGWKQTPTAERPMSNRKSGGRGRLARRKGLGLPSRFGRKSEVGRRGSLCFLPCLETRSLPALARCYPSQLLKARAVASHPLRRSMSRIPSLHSVSELWGGSFHRRSRRERRWTEMLAEG